MSECDHVIGHEIEDNGLVEWYECTNCDTVVDAAGEEVQG